MIRFGMIHHRAPGDTLEVFLDYAAETGFDVVELSCTDVWPSGDENPEHHAERVRGLLAERGITASALSSDNDFVVLQEDAIREQVQRMARLSKLATIIGTNVLRTEGGARKPEVPLEQEADAMAECLKRCVEFAERDGTYLAVDNHGHVTNNPKVLIQALRTVGSRRVGSNLDTANFRWAGHSVEACRDIYDAVAPYALHTHVKDCVGSASDYRGTVLGEGEVDVPYAIGALRRAGYDGAYTVEWEGAREEDGAVAYAQCLAWMRQHVTG